MKHWKQPVDTDIINNEAFDTFDCSVWYHIIMQCRNEAGALPPFFSGNKKFEIELERGQMVFRIRQFARDHIVDRKKVRKSIDKLSKWYHKMDHETKPYGLIITVLNYDEIIKMDHKKDTVGTMKEPQENNEGSTSNKSVKNNKNEKNEKKEREKKTSLTPTLSLTEEINNVLEHFIKKGYMKSFLDLEVEKFISYWTEPNTKGKMRWQCEKFFDVKRRLATWFKRAEEYNPGRAKPQSIPSF